MILNTLLLLLGVFFSEEGINWWKTPPELPDANPIENLWHELKEYIRQEIKPSTKVELITGIGILLVYRNAISTLTICVKFSLVLYIWMEQQLDIEAF